MPKIIDHNSRKDMILKNALDIFAQEGYSNASLAEIAERSGLSRPTVYRYFHDKEEVYYYAVKQITGKMFTKYSAIAWNQNDKRDELERIVLIFEDIIDTAKANEGAMTHLMEVMLEVKRENQDFSSVINKRTAKMSILIKRLLRQAKNNGKISQDCNINKIADEIFYLAESCCFHIAFFKSFDRDAAIVFCDTILNGIRL